MLDEKCISGVHVLNVQKSVSIQGLRPVDSDQRLTMYPRGRRAYSSPDPQLLNCYDRTEPSNFREVGGLKKNSGMREVDPL